MQIMKETLACRFTVITYRPQPVRLGVVGSSEELGRWRASHCLPLVPLSRLDDADLPVYTWGAVVQIDLTRAEREFEYKFVAWTPTDKTSLVSPPRPPLTKTNEFDVELDKCLDPVTPPGPGTDLVWELNWGGGNRRFVHRTQRSGSGQLEEEGNLVHAFEEERLVDLGGAAPEYVLPICHFLDNSDLSEPAQTTRYYRALKAALRMHTCPITTFLTVGTCPRLPAHLEALKAQYSAVVNLQAEEDATANWPDPSTPLKERTPETLHEMYDALDMPFIWYPTADMSTSGRARMMANVAVLMREVMEPRPAPRLYLHCNAGVGRAVAAASGYLRLIAGLPSPHVHLLLAVRRPVAFYDSVAAEMAAEDFRRKFAPEGKV